MLELVIGGAASGKSQYAEEATLKMGGWPVYLATMEALDAESEKRIAIHQKRREQTGFVTVECARNVSAVEIEEPHSVILLECLSNLLANEMFSGEAGFDGQFDHATKIWKDIFNLYERKHVDHMVIVTNNIFEDGFSYDEATTRYIKTLGRLNARLAKSADKFTEVICGIAV